MSSHVINGKAFEYAVANAFSEHSGFPVSDREQEEEYLSYFEQLPTRKRNLFSRLAQESASHILEKEKRLWQNREGVVDFTSDARGQEGDVRDICLHSGNKTLGLSCKTNHRALKHSRLSGTIDFVDKWGLLEGIECSQEYWSVVRNIFDTLRELQALKPGMLWREFAKKEECYRSVLDAFASEVLRVKGLNEKIVCKNLIAYLFGIQDFYKIISRISENKVEIHGFNFNGTLNLPQTDFPDELIDIRDSKRGRYSKVMYFSDGFSISFRIHNASSKVEPSLKFDINAPGLPDNVYRHTCEI